MGLKQREQKTFANIISDGTIRVRTEETNPKAVRRDYELKNGIKGTKYELVYNELSGIITGVEFYDGEYGKSLNISVRDGEAKILLSVGMQSNYAEDIMKKMPALDLDKETIFKPYNFKDKKTGKLKRGVSINQGENKIMNFFSDADKNMLHNFPEFEKDKKYDTEDWKIYFIKTRKFLQKYIEDNIIPKIFAQNLNEAGIETKNIIVDREEEININDVPFGD